MGSAKANPAIQMTMMIILEKNLLGFRLNGYMIALYLKRENKRSVIFLPKFFSISFFFSKKNILFFIVLKKGLCFNLFIPSHVEKDTNASFKKAPLD